MPKIETIDIKEEILNDQMNGLFSIKLIYEIGNTLKEKKQVILFMFKK